MLTHGLLGDGEDGAAGKSCRELGRILPILFQMQNGGAEATLPATGFHGAPLRSTCSRQVIFPLPPLYISILFS